MADEQESLYDLYRDDIKRLSIENHTSSGVLYACVLAVVNFNSHEHPEQTARNHAIAPIAQIYSSTGEFTELQLNGAHGIFQNLVQTVHGTPEVGSDIITSDVDDSLTARISKGFNPRGDSIDDDNYTKASAAGLALFEKHAVVRGQIANLLAGQVLPLKPQMTSTERGIKETELLSFSSLSTADLYRNDQMQTIATMLAAHVRALPNFTGTLRSGTGEDGTILRRRYFRHLSAQTFAQILSAERVREPVVVKQYYPLTDDLLLALHWPPPDRRIKQESWSWTGPIPVLSSEAAAAATIEKEKSVKGKKKGGKAPEKKKTGKKSKHEEPVAPTTLTCNIHTTTLTPAAHSIALVKKSAEASATPWLSVHVNGSLLGLRMETSYLLTADFLAEQDGGESLRDNKSAHSARSAHSAHSNHSHDSHHDSHHDSKAAIGLGSPENSKVLGSGMKGDLASSTASLFAQDAPRGMFFCQTEDDVRFSACVGPSPSPSLKPDGFGTICLLATFLDTMTVTVCSNGTTRITSPQASSSALTQSNGSGKHGAPANSAANVVVDSFVGVETDRFIGSGGTVMSLYSKASNTITSGDGSMVQFSKEIREADGSRLLIVRTDYSGAVITSLSAAFGEAHVDNTLGVPSRSQSVAASMKASGFKKGTIGAFYQNLCAAAPAGWTCVKLGADGSVVFHSCPPDSSLLDGAQGVPHPALHNAMCTTLIDAETKAAVTTFQDGRVVIMHADGRRESRFGDGTVIVKHSEGAMVSVTKRNMPAVEIDTEIDAVSRQHARGIEVPINKGGERVRSRIALPDGSAILVKYDTRLTTTTNGSIKLVRRDKTVILLKDSGSVIYTPRASWNDKAAAAFAAECADLPQPVVSAARGVTIATGSLTAGPSTAAPSSPTSRGSSAPRSPTSLTSADRASAQPSTVTPSVAAGSKSTKRVGMPAAGPSSMVRSSRRNNANRAKFAASGKGTNEQVVEKEAEEASFMFDIIKFTCKILDYEFNSFFVDLSSPDVLKPAVTLSGEVEGLKPPAVADKPMDPRLFVVNRAAEATELLSFNAVSSAETLVKMCPDVTKLTAPVHLQPSDLGPATLSKYFIRRRLLGSKGDAFSFEEVFGQRYWYPNSTPTPAAVLMAEQNNKAMIAKSLRKKQQNPGNTVQMLPPRYFEVLSLVEQSPLSQEGHVQLQRAIQKCEEFRNARLQSLDRFKVEEDRSREELDEEEALSKRLKLAFKAAKVNAAKKKEQKAKQMAAATPTVPEEGPAPSPSQMVLKRQHSAIPEGDNEDDEDGDMPFPDDDETAEMDPEELEVRDTFDDFATQAVNDGFTVDDHPSLARASLQDALIRLFNRHIAEDTIDYEMSNCVECDASYDELTYTEFKSLYYSMKVSFAQQDASPAKGLRITTMSHDQGEGEETGFSPETKGSDHTAVSSPTYWRSPQGQKVMKTLPPSAPPLDFRKLEWEQQQEQLRLEQLRQDLQNKFDEMPFDESQDSPTGTGMAGRMVSTAYPAVGSALQAARRSNNNRAVTAPE